MFRPSGFTQSIRAPLILLYDHGEPLQQKEMALRLGLEASALVRVVRILSERGLICWQKEPHDKRAKSIELTDAGRVTCEMILAESNRIERYLLKDISAEDLQTFREVLAKISSRLPDS